MVSSFFYYKGVRQVEDHKEELLSHDEAKHQIAEWKDQYQAIYMSEIEDVHFIWRGLTRAEYRKALELYEDDYDRAEYVCKVCVLEPLDVDYSDEIYAGFPETLAEQILVESGFTADDSKIKELTRKYDEEMNRFENQVSCVIAEVFSNFTIDEIDNWSMEKTLWYFARAKWTLRTLRGIELTEEGNTAIPGLPADFPVAPNAK